MYDLPQELTVTAEGSVRIVTINRPDRHNAANGALHRGLVDVWRHLKTDRGAKVVILTGAGANFCAGADYDWLLEMHVDPEAQEAVIQEGTELLLEMIHFPLPVIAAVNGPAVGIGCNLAVTCDIVLMSDRAHLADPHVAVGLVAGDGGASIWPVLGSMVRLKEFLFTGAQIPAHTSVELGLATRVVPHDDLMNEAMTVAGRMERLPQRALRDTKRTVNLHLARSSAGIIQTGFGLERQSMGSADHGERLARLSGGEK
jgi:enoyl-CoA hydratase